MTNRFENKIVLITGAGSGIGAATAKQFAREKAIVVVTDIDESLGKKIENEINANNSSAFFIKLDVSDEENWKNTIKNIESKFSKLDILVNNAGITIEGPVTEFSLKDWRKLMAINLDGVFLGTKHAIPLITKSGGGSIINLSSISGLTAEPNASAYCASKGAVRLFTKAVALECAQARNNIRVNSIHPGPVATPIFEKGNGWQDYVKKMGGVENAWKAVAAQTPLNRIATPEEIAKAICYLASEDASYMIGSELVVDGGFTAQ